MKKNWAYKLLRMMKWTPFLDIELPKKCVICVAPHTSNWDFFYGILYKYVLGIRASFFMKKELFFFPLGNFMRSLGGIAIDRSSKHKITDLIAQEIEKQDDIYIAITPEGTRSYNKEWKKGFYFIAQKANVPIVLGYIDFKEKRVGLSQIFTPTGDVESDIEKIKEFYKDKNAKYPNKFGY